MGKAVPNPFSSGQGGGFFEAKVQASFLINLLIGGRIPCLPSGGIQSVRLQAKQAGYDTDDALVIIRSESGTEHRLLAQIKHHAAITVSDPEFYDSMASAWSDFNNTDKFVKGRDSLAVITGPQSDRTLQHVRPLLDWARTSATSIEFDGKVATVGFSSGQKRTYRQVFRDVITKVAGIEPTDDILWQFLKHLYLLSYDFDVQDSKDEAAVLTVLDMARSLSGGLDAQAIWEGLIVQAQEWNKTAGTYTSLAFPDRLRSAVQPQRSSAQRDAVLRLKEHTDFVLGDINTELAPGIRLPRSNVLDIVADALDPSRIIVVQGLPGSGKSAIVKMLIEALPNGITPFVFKAKEFNFAHIHQFLTSIGVDLTIAQLRCEFALLPRKLLLVDGAEQLFELNNFDAFRHLLQQLSDDDSWTVVITCRESSAQSLKEHLLAQWVNDVTTVTISPFSTDELEWVSGRDTKLTPLIANQRLTRLIRLPFILSLAWKASPLSVSTEAVSDIDERLFKEIIWQDYVERSSQTQGGLHIKRGQCLLSVSVERARQMSLFVSSEGLDAEALNALTYDGILIKSKTGGFAPAHDVLEDWAVARFIAQEFETKAGDPLRFVETVGAEPAMRRGFRLWLSEALAAPSNQPVMDFILSAFQHANVPHVWRDEIAVAVLQSENAGDFIRAVDQLLIDSNKALYRQLVHILRTACKGPNESFLRKHGLAAFRNHEVLGSVFVTPVGSGWREVILFTHRNLATFGMQDAGTVLGLLKDWAQGLVLSEPLPAEAPAVAQICLKYWEILTAPDLYVDRMEQEFLQLLFKIPDAAPTEITSLIRFALANEMIRTHHSTIVLEHVTKSFECQPLCAHFPDLVIEVAESTWRLQPEDKSHYRSHPDLDELFGLDHLVQFQYFPVSALQGPFTFLLASHPEIAVNFIVRLTNQTTLSYSKSERGREVYNVQIPTASGTRTLIASPHLWVLYRGMMAGPQVIECALMALEGWLLGQAKQGNDIREVFRKILDTSLSAATVAVLASVATAYPEAVADEVLSILGVKEFYLWDFERSHQEPLHKTDIRAMMGVPTGGMKEIYYQERNASDDLTHRKSNLEELALYLQWTPLRDRIWSILDNFYQTLPPEHEQSKSEKLWRIALHRMDSRHFKARKGKEPGMIEVTPGEPAPDIQQFIAKTEEENAPANRSIHLTSWGMIRFRRETQSIDAFPDWRDALREAQAFLELKLSDIDGIPLGKSGPCFVAAYLIRDHYADLTDSEIEWCRKLIIETVLLKDAERTFNTIISKNSYDGSRPCALVLPLLLTKAIDEQIRLQVEECLAVAVTHTSEEVRDYAAEGVRSWLWEIDHELAKACVGGLFELSDAENRIRLTERRRKKFSQEDLDSKVWDATRDIRARIVKRATSTALNKSKVDLNTHDWPELLDALSMINHSTKDLDLRAFFMACLTAALHDAEADEAWKSDHHAHFEFQHDFARLFARFALARSVDDAVQIGQLLRGYVERCPKYLGELVDALPYEEDKVRSIEAFWGIWKNVSVPIFEHPLLRGPSRIWRYDNIRKLVRVLLFADIEWKEGVKEWAVISTNKDFIESAASVVGNTPAGFGALVTFLSKMGQDFLPDIIVLLASSMNKSDGKDLLDDLNTQFDLEVLLRKTCYGFGTVIRQRPELHRSTLLLLDKLVERGSHTAFRLRDYIVSPLPTVK